MKTLKIRKISALIAWICVLVAPVRAEDFAVIGTGMMGTSFGTQLGAHGHTVIYGSRSPESDRILELVETTGPNASAESQVEAAAGGNIVVLAVPREAIDSVVAELRPYLAGKIVIDVGNNVIMGDNNLPQYVDGLSNGEIVQALAPEARVVKAFNTIGFHVLRDPSRANGVVTIPVASDDDEAKVLAMSLAADFGFEPYDAGPLRNGRVLEAMSALYRTPHFQGRRDDTFEYYLRRVNEPDLDETRAVRGDDAE